MTVGNGERKKTQYDELLYTARKKTLDPFSFIIVKGDIHGSESSQ